MKKSHVSSDTSWLQAPFNSMSRCLTFDLFFMNADQDGIGFLARFTLTPCQLRPTLLQRFLNLGGPLQPYATRSPGKRVPELHQWKPMKCFKCRRCVSAFLPALAGDGRVWFDCSCLIQLLFRERGAERSCPGLL